MIRNLPLLILMLIAGNSALTLTQTMQIPEVLFWFLLVISVILNIWGIIGLVLYFWIQKVEN